MVTITTATAMGTTDAISFGLTAFTMMGGGAILLAIVQAIIAKVTGKQREARERDTAIQADHDAAVARETRRADAADARAAEAFRREAHERARADVEYDRRTRFLNWGSRVRAIAIQHGVNPDLLPQPPSLEPEEAT